MVDRRLGDGILDVIFFACHLEGSGSEGDDLWTLEGSAVTTSAEPVL